MLDGVLTRMDAHQYKKTPQLRVLHSWQADFRRSLTEAFRAAAVNWFTRSAATADFNASSRFRGAREQHLERVLFGGVSKGVVRLHDV